MAQFCKISGVWVLLALYAAVLAACGGASDSAAAAGGTGAGGQAATVACALTGCEIAKLAATANMPSGSASYLGRATATTTTAQGTLITTNADLGLSANFKARTVDVTLSQIQTSSGTLSGSATGTGTISSNTFDATYVGPISGTLDGTFRGDGAAALNGTLTILGGGAMGGDAFGQFFANKQ